MSRPLYAHTDHFGRPRSIPERVGHRAGHHQRGGQSAAAHHHHHHRGHRPDDDGRRQHRGQRDRDVVHSGGARGRPERVRPAVRSQFPRTAPAVQLRAPDRPQGTGGGLISHGRVVLCRQPACPHVVISREFTSVKPM